MIDLENDIRTRLERLIKPEFINSWLDTPNLAFGYKRPIDLINENDLDKLHKMLYVLENGEQLRLDLMKELSYGEKKMRFTHFEADFNDEWGIGGTDPFDGKEYFCGSDN